MKTTILLFSFYKTNSLLKTIIIIIIIIKHYKIKIKKHPARKTLHLTIKMTFGARNDILCQYVFFNRNANL